MSSYAAKLKKLFQRIGTTAAAYGAKHPAGKRVGNGKMKDELALILPEYSSFVASGITSTQVTLTWSGITGSTSHKLEKSTDANFVTGITTVYTGALLTANATGLTTATTYYFRVTSIGAGKVSSISKVVKVITS